MVPDLTFEIKPLVVGQQHAKRDNFSHHHFADSIEIATAFGKIRDAGGVALFATVPNRVEVYAQPGSRSSFIHGPVAIIEFLVRRAKENLNDGLQTANAKGFGNNLERRGQSSRKFAVDFQIDLRVAIGGPDRDFPC